jgi:hypothetical protein
VPERRLSRESIGQRGLEIYQGLRPQLESCHHGRFVAIDVETGEYEVADESSLASDDLWDRCPRAQIFVERIGYPAAFVARELQRPS